jgi:hypothetical protein
MPILKNFVAVAVVATCSLVVASLLTQPSAGAANEANEKKDLRAFYLTNTEHTGALAPTACAPGFHMASLWEIFDTSNLKYDTTLGHTRDDSGGGPPTAGGAHGWIRTGSFSEGNSGSAGLDNCSAWMTSSSTQNGTAAALTFIWTVPAVTGGVMPWRGIVLSCDSTEKVWCVED